MSAVSEEVTTPQLMPLPSSAETRTGNSPFLA
jgi:hypothetical protein